MYLSCVMNMRAACRSPAVSKSRCIDVLIHLEKALVLQSSQESQQYRNTVEELVKLLVDLGRMKEA